MTQIVTISANTAAYAAEPLKPSARVSGSPSENAITAFAEEARRSGDAQQRSLMNIVQPPALALFFLTAGQQGRQTQLTLQQVKENYALNENDENAVIEETTANETPFEESVAAEPQADADGPAAFDGGSVETTTE